MNLFVIGNGFDLEHNLKTSYHDFKNFLINNYKIDLNDNYDFILPSYATNYRRLEEYDAKEFATFFLNLIDDCSEYIDTWQDFEECLGKIDWYKIFDNDFPLVDEGDEYTFRDKSEFYETKTDTLLESCHILKLLFNNWILSIEEKIKNDLNSLHVNDDAIIKFNDIFNQDDLFLSFNYTSTLEKIYKIKNVCHIHGSINPYNELIVGHGLEEYESYQYNELFDEANDSIRDIFYEFKKDTIQCYEKNADFFTKIRDVENIYFYGFSFSNVDMFYVKKIKEYVNTNVKVYVNIHDKKATNEILNKLKMFDNVKTWEI